jgi:hypothetical protein
MPCIEILARPQECSLAPGRRSSKSIRHTSGRTTSKGEDQLRCRLCYAKNQAVVSIKWKGTS